MRKMASCGEVMVATPSNHAPLLPQRPSCRRRFLILVKQYQVLDFGEPVRVCPELGEEAPRHADMLRYDLAFCDPAHPDLVVFPIFNSKDRRTSQNITEGGWDTTATVLTVEDTAGDLVDAPASPAER